MVPVYWMDEIEDDTLRDFYDADDVEGVDDENTYYGPNEELPFDVVYDAEGGDSGQGDDPIEGDDIEDDHDSSKHIEYKL